MAVKWKMSEILKKTLKGQFIKELQKKINMDIVADLAIDLIYKRVKAGYGVTDQKAKAPQKDKLTPLSEGYKKYRKKNKPTGEGASPNKSNLTYSGQLLKSLKADTSNAKVKINAKGQHKSGISNAKLAEYVQELRPFLALTDKEQKQVMNKLKEIFRSIVERNK